jgi:hypothetical protein
MNAPQVRLFKSQLLDQLAGASDRRKNLPALAEGSQDNVAAEEACRSRQ